mgnify:CR=1 FL=1
MTFEQLLWILTFASSLVGLGSGVFLYRSSKPKSQPKQLPTRVQIPPASSQQDKVRPLSPSRSLSTKEKLTRIVQMKDELKRRNDSTSPTQPVSEGFVKDMGALIKFMEN